MGLNLSIKRIVFSTLRKYDGDAQRTATAAEVKQIAGRAGRLFFFVVCLILSSNV